MQLKLKLHQLRRIALWLSKLHQCFSYNSVSLLTGARSFSLGNSFLKLNSLWTVLLLPLCDQPGLRTTENNFALSFSRFLLVLLSLFTDANSCGRKSKSKLRIDIRGETTIIVEFSKVRATLAKRGNSWKIKLLPKPVAVKMFSLLCPAKLQTLV